jgi:hypothetical protein
MSIQLSPDEREYLERLEHRRMKPSRRQKAIALIRLSKGLTPAEAAKHAGIPKEEVVKLAAGFAEHGSAGVVLGGKPEVLVRLVRPGVGTQKHDLPEGATLADLLRRSGATTADQVIYVDGVISRETSPLRDGAVVMIVPRPKTAAGVEPWRATLPSFQDEDLFQEYREALKEYRQSLAPEEEPAA